MSSPVQYNGDESKLTRCKECDCYVYPPYGADSPATHAGNEGTKEDPRAPGDRDNICDQCGYA